MAQSGLQSNVNDRNRNPSGSRKARKKGHAAATPLLARDPGFADLDRHDLFGIRLVGITLEYRRIGLRARFEGASPIVETDLSRLVDGDRLERLIDRERPDRADD
jgi:hypothetical protein